jgi:hypothetical protein
MPRFPLIRLFSRPFSHLIIASSPDYAATFKDKTSGALLTTGKITQTMLKIINAGVLIDYVKKYGNIRV